MRNTTTGDPVVREAVERIRQISRRSAEDQQNGQQGLIGGERAAGSRGRSSGEGSENDLLLAAPDVSYVYIHEVHCCCLTICCFSSPSPTTTHTHTDKQTLLLAWVKAILTGVCADLAWLSPL